MQPRDRRDYPIYDVLRLRQDGLSMRRIAAALDLNRRTVMTILNEQERQYQGQSAGPPATETEADDATS